jgi:hypothetical protein
VGVPGFEVLKLGGRAASRTYPSDDATAYLPAGIYPDRVEMTDIFLLAEMFLHFRWGWMGSWYLLAAKGEPPEVVKVQKERRTETGCEEVP